MFKRIPFTVNLRKEKTASVCTLANDRKAITSFLSYFERVLALGEQKIWGCEGKFLGRTEIIFSKSLKKDKIIKMPGL